MPTKRSTVRAVETPLQKLFRQRREMDARRTHPLTPALIFLCMTGSQTTVRVAGWVDLSQTDDVDGIVRTVWANHGAALTAEAEAAGFTPWAATGQVPHGPTVDAWIAAFVQQHRY